MRVSRIGFGLLIFAASAVPVRAEGPFIGQFELKNLESAPGYLEFQSQNAYTFGHPRRGVKAGDDETLFDENEIARLRHALEMEMGFTRYLKARIGIEFEQERFDEPGTISEAESFDKLRLTEIGGEVIAILIPRDGDGFGLGTVVEVERPVLSASGDPMALIMGPIVEWAQGRLSVSLVPMAVHHFGGRAEEDGESEPLDHKWDFAYAAQAAYAASDRWTFAVEAYGTVDRLGSSGAPSESNKAFGDLDQHRLGPIVYWSTPLDDKPASLREVDEEGSELTVGLGYFAGLTDATPDGTLKLSVEVDF